MKNLSVCSLELQKYLHKEHLKYINQTNSAILFMNKLFLKIAHFHKNAFFKLMIIKIKMEPSNFFKIFYAFITKFYKILHTLFAC